MKMRRRRTSSNKSVIGSQPVITLYRQRIPKEKFDSLSEVDRYCFLLLGHVHDEISWLQRMALIASQSGLSDDAAQQSGDMMQMTFLARLLLGKLFEFKRVLSTDSSPLPQFIASSFDPEDEKVGRSRVDEILAYYRKEKWIRVARNKHFLHYPDFTDVIDTIKDPEIDWQVDIYHGKKSANTLFPTSDVMANYAWFRLANPKSPMEGFTEALDTIRELAKLTLGTLEYTLANFVDRRLLDLSDNEEIKLTVRDNLKDLRLSYFICVGNA